MAVIILKEALKELILRGKWKKPAHGYLLGQRVGQSLFIDRILILSWPQLLRTSTLLEVEKNQRREVLGVFSLNSRRGQSSQLLKPLFLEKIYLNLQATPKNELKPLGRVVKFNRRFFFEPLKRIILEMEAADE